jgi:hypothetical protein
LSSHFPPAQGHGQPTVDPDEHAGLEDAVQLDVKVLVVLPPSPGKNVCGEARRGSKGLSRVVDVPTAASAAR